MKIGIDGIEYEVEIIRKNNKNMYLRIKKDLSIVVTAPKFIAMKNIESFVMEHSDYIAKVIRKNIKSISCCKDKFLYLGKLYDICYVNDKDICFGENRVYLGKKLNIDNWYKKQAKIIFSNLFDICFSSFCFNGKKPDLKVRKMKSKWGVCNVTNNIITLNLELIKYDNKFLEYVIYHELSHLVHPNHSKDFWKLVEKYVTDYKIIRKEMKNL